MSEVKKVEPSDDCDSCGGWGDHGVEEETGCLYVCYACGGTGKMGLALEVARSAAVALEGKGAAS
jgi:hypothetical protein